MEYDMIFAAARRAGNELALVDAGRLSRTVVKAAALLRVNAGKVLAANALDLEAMDADSPMRDRLRLTAERIASIAADMESVAGLPSPQGETIAEWTRPNGMTLRKVRFFGVPGGDEDDFMLNAVTRLEDGRCFLFSADDDFMQSYVGKQRFMAVL